ncbi:hypothetical protein TD95_003576 [Thielaviopsis punctulata]|uniref:Cyclin-domain-containing protein n=1 Tax=Thielaviopsis punctulata TaxID=72032 RepID=A0A0F4ZJK6_9PEZI|nr:hypothetical protein TD95_003576 [Thielaviopsis punctulata]
MIAQPNHHHFSHPRSSSAVISDNKDTNSLSAAIHAQNPTPLDNPAFAPAAASTSVSAHHPALALAFPSVSDPDSHSARRPTVISAVSSAAAATVEASHARASAFLFSSSSASSSSSSFACQDDLPRIQHIRHENHLISPQPACASSETRASVAASLDSAPASATDSLFSHPVTDTDTDADPDTQDAHFCCSSFSPRAASASVAPYCHGSEGRGQGREHEGERWKRNMASMMAGHEEKAAALRHSHPQPAPQSQARAGKLTGAPSETADDDTPQVRYDISPMPVEDVIEMVAALLTKITTTNDEHHAAMQPRNLQYAEAVSAAAAAASASASSASAASSSTTPATNPVSTSVLAFHGRNVPAITIHSYLSRVHRYCPTIYEVFLSLLVYFDRMTESVNIDVLNAEKQQQQQQQQQQKQQKQHQKGKSKAVDVDMDGKSSTSESSSSSSASTSPSTSEDNESIIDDVTSQDGQVERPERPPAPRKQASVTAVNPPATAGATYFVVDSYNIHRLIIAGVTCASKFFSDIFYTNSRYAKVGGIPLPELNHLELQFLLLNDFRLFIPARDLEAYATMLVEFYAREVIKGGKD